MNTRSLALTRVNSKNHTLNKCQSNSVTDTVLKHAKCDLNGVKITIFAAKSPSSWEFCTLCDTLELQRFV